MDRKQIARIAGLIYLIVVITGMFSLAYVPGQLIVYEDAGLTFNNILKNETLFRLAIASAVICYTAFILLPIALSRLLKSVNALCANVMVILVLISIPISFINLHNKFAILSLLREVKEASTPDLDKVYQQTMKYLHKYDDGIFITTVFWGLWLLPFGYLVFRSGFLPRILGILLILGGAGYLINFFGNTMSAEYGAYGVSKYLRLLPAIAELSTCFWLFIIGTKTKRNTLEI